MPEAEQVTTPETVAPESEALEGQTVAADTTETVAETDEQKNQRELAERQKRSERQSRGIQRRFDELTAEKHAAMRQVEQLTSLVQQALGQRTAQASPQNANAEPVRGQDEAYEDWVARRAEWRAEQRAEALVQRRLQAVEQQTSQQRMAEQATQVRQKFESRMQEYAGKQSDWADVVANNDDVSIPDQAAGLIHLDDEGPAILYAIGKNPALAAQLHGKNIVQQAMVLGQIKAMLKTSPQVSKAPTPGRPVGSRGGPVANEPSDSDDMATWLKKRSAQVRGK